METWRGMGIAPATIFATKTASIKDSLLQKPVKSQGKLKGHQSERAVS
jgi:hypothetical protein